MYALDVQHSSFFTASAQFLSMLSLKLFLWAPWQCWHWSNELLGNELSLPQQMSPRLAKSHCTTDTHRLTLWQPIYTSQSPDHGSCWHTQPTFNVHWQVTVSNTNQNKVRRSLSSEKEKQRQRTRYQFLESPQSSKIVIVQVSQNASTLLDWSENHCIIIQMLVDYLETEFSN